MVKKPAYMVIADALRARIESHELAPGDRLPSERELVERFGVARMTIRHALDMVQAEGLIERRRGRNGGTFIRATPPVLELNSGVGFEEYFAAEDSGVTSATRSLGQVSAPHSVANAFKVEPGSEVTERQVVFSSEGQPLMFATCYTLPGRAREDMSPGPECREDILTATRASDRECEALGLGTNAVVQRVTRSMFVGDDLTEFSLIAIRPDAAKLRAVTTG